MDRQKDTHTDGDDDKTPSALKMGSIDSDLQGHFVLKLITFRKNELNHTITCQVFKHFQHGMCILGPFGTYLKMGSIDLDLQHVQDHLDLY